MRRRLATIAACLAVAGCSGGGSSGPQATWIDTSPTFAISNAAQGPIRHVYTKAGTYTLTLSGSFSSTRSIVPDTLYSLMSFSGRGSIVAGNAYGLTAITGVGQSIAINQSITVNMTGDGPWQLDVLCYTTRESTTGSMTDLTLKSELQ